jgi:hypothetical protein
VWGDHSVSQPRTPDGRYASNVTVGSIVAAAVVAIAAAVGVGAEGAAVGAGTTTTAAANVPSLSAPARVARGKQKSGTTQRRLVTSGLRSDLRAEADSGSCAADAREEVREFLTTHPCESVYRAMFEVRRGDVAAVVAVAWIEMVQESDATELKALVDRPGDRERQPVATSSRPGGGGGRGSRLRLASAWTPGRHGGGPARGGHRLTTRSRADRRRGRRHRQPAGIATAPTRRSSCPPHRTLGRLRPHQPRQPDPVVPASPPGDPPRALADRHDRRPPVVHPTMVDRPRTTTETRRKISRGLLSRPENASRTEASRTTDAHPRPRLSAAARSAPVRSGCSRAARARTSPSEVRRSRAAPDHPDQRARSGHMQAIQACGTPLRST